MNILIADDSPIFRARLFTVLDEIEDLHIVGQAQSGQETLELFRRLRPDAVVLDIRMPGMTGIQVLEELKKEVPGILVVMMTNYPYQQYRERCLAAGADHFFDKSCEIEKIIEVFSSSKPKQEAVS